MDAHWFMIHHSIPNDTIKCQFKLDVNISPMLPGRPHPNVSKYKDMHV